MRRYLTMLSMSATLAAGCGSSGSGDGATTQGPAVTADQACAAYAHAACSRLSSCAPLLQGELWTDAAACEARAQLTCGHVFTDNGSLVDPPALDRCAGVLQALSCPDFLSFLVSGAAPAACQLPPGRLEEGAACEQRAQCASSSCQKTGANDACGTCAPTPLVGDVCSNDASCPTGSLCSSGICQSTAGIGGACDSAHPCMLGIPCVSGRCATPKPAGASCTFSTSHDECDNLLGAFCHPKTGICTIVSMAGVGEACGGGELAICGASGTCEGATATTSGTCSAAAADSAACDDTNGPKCTSPARCVSGTCQTTFACQ